MQMNQPWGRGEESIESSEMLNQSQSIIGTGEWDDIQCRYFTGEDNRAMKIGDIILVREGKRPLAICEITSDCFQDEKLKEKFNHENYRNVNVVGWLNEDERFPIVQGTLRRLTDPETESWKLIDLWYKEITQKN